jgi:hypothetical protein
MSPTLGDGDIVVVRFGAPVRIGDREGDGWWVLGDNPYGSTDSRTLGPADVPAVVRWRLWPRPGRVRRVGGGW